MVEKANPKLQKNIRLDDIHSKLIQGLIPFYGSTEAEVIRNIVIIWLHDNIGSNTIKELQSLGAISLKKDQDVND